MSISSIIKRMFSEAKDETLDNDKTTMPKRAIIENIEKDKTIDSTAELKKLERTWDPIKCKRCTDINKEISEALDSLARGKSVDIHISDGLILTNNGKIWDNHPLDVYLLYKNSMFPIYINCHYIDGQDYKDPYSFYIDTDIGIIYLRQIMNQIDIDHEFLGERYYDWTELREIRDLLRPGDKFEFLDGKVVLSRDNESDYSIIIDGITCYTNSDSYYCINYLCKSLESNSNGYSIRYQVG